jgi:hypothetical protein
MKASELSVSAVNAGPLWEQPKTISGIIAGRVHTNNPRLRIGYVGNHHLAINGCG